MSSRISRGGRTAVLCLLLVLVTVAFYEPVIHNGFTNFDDIYYILKNPHVQAGLTWDTVKWAFTKFYASNWHPLTWLSHALDCQLFKLEAGGPHLESALWHAGNAVLLFGVLTRRQVGYWRSSETLWRHTLSVTEGNYPAHYNLACDLVAQNRPQEAIVEFKTVDSVNGYTPQEMLQVGLYEQTHGDLPDAIDEYGRILNRVQDQPSRSLLLSSLGGAFVQAGDLGRARESYTNALKENSDSGAALVGDGLLAERTGDLARAVTQISHSVKVEPSDVGYLLLGQALHRAGRTGEAADAESAARKISGDFVQAQQNAAQILAAAGLPPQSGSIATRR